MSAQNTDVGRTCSRPSRGFVLRFKLWGVIRGPDTGGRVPVDQFLEASDSRWSRTMHDVSLTNISGSKMEPEQLTVLLCKPSPVKSV